LIGLTVFALLPAGISRMLRLLKFGHLGGCESRNHRNCHFSSEHRLLCIFLRQIQSRGKQIVVRSSCLLRRAPPSDLAQWWTVLAPIGRLFSSEGFARVPARHPELQGAAARGDGDTGRNRRRDGRGKLGRNLELLAIILGLLQLGLP